MPSATSPKEESQYFAVPPLMLFAGTSGEFSVYLRVRERYILYAGPRETFTQAHKERLHETGVKRVYVLAEHREAYERYLEENLGAVLADDGLPVTERASVFYDVSLNIVREIFDSRLPGGLDSPQVRRLMGFVRKGIRFLAVDDALKSLASLIGHDYQTYSHSVHVFVYSSAILRALDYSDEELMEAGLGAMLHDMGKCHIPRSVLNKKGRLSPQEWDLIRTHPAKGVALCANVPVSQTAINTVLLHHERVDGSGYPSGIKGHQIPLHVKAATVADVYDALTCERPYAPKVSPFEALTIMRDQMTGHFDHQVYKRLVLVLSGADIV